MSFNSSNVNVMKEAVNALPIMKEVIEKVPLMEQVASETAGSGIVTNAMPPPGGNDSGIMNGYNPVQPMMAKATMKPAKTMTKKPAKVAIPGYAPGTVKTVRPKPAKPVVKLSAPIQAPLSLNTDEVINNITGVQSQLSNSLLNQVNGILANIGEQTMNTVMPNMSGGLVMKMTKPPIGRIKSKTMGLVAPGTKCPPCKPGTMRIAGTCQCAPLQNSPKKRFDNVINAVNQNIDSISNGLAIISKYLPCAACPSCPECPPCESSNPGMQSEEPSAYEEQPTEQEGGRRSGTRRSRVKKSKKTLRNRRS